jgi:hypothetical protein
MRQEEINDGMAVVRLSTLTRIGEGLRNGCLRSRVLHCLRSFDFGSESGAERLQSTRSCHNTDSDANTEADMQIESV